MLYSRDHPLRCNHFPRAMHMSSTMAILSVPPKHASLGNPERATTFSNIICLGILGAQRPTSPSRGQPSRPFDRNQPEPASVFLTRLVHRWLPVGKRLLLYCAHFGHCPTCANRTLETTQHLFHCPCRQAWRAEFNHGLRTSLRIFHTSTDLTNEILTNCDDWLHSRPPSISSPQNNIGWEQFLYGFIPVEWVNQQSLYLSTLIQAPDRYTGDSWAAQLVDYLWTFMQALWKQRCDDLHARTAHQPGSRPKKYRNK